jgi:hypothetical protein
MWVCFGQFLVSNILKYFYKRFFEDNDEDIKYLNKDNKFLSSLYFKNPLGWVRNIVGYEAADCMGACCLWF